MMACALLALGIAALAIASAREPLFAGGFVVSVVALLGLLTLLGVAISKGAARLPRPTSPLLRLAIANLHRPGAQTGRLVVALGLGLTLFATLAVIQTSLNAQIESTIPKRAPSFFALDIAKEDQQRFIDTIKAIDPKAQIKTVPALRGPVVEVAGKRVADMKDIPEEAWFLRGDRGLTFADDLPGTDDDAAHARIGMGGIQALARQLEGARHAALIEHGLFSRRHCLLGSRDRRSISSRNSLRS